jgi:hypothetical protein
MIAIILSISHSRAVALSLIRVVRRRSGLGSSKNRANAEELRLMTLGIMTTAQTSTLRSSIGLVVRSRLLWSLERIPVCRRPNGSHTP